VPTLEHSEATREEQRLYEPQKKKIGEKERRVETTQKKGKGLETISTRLLTHQQREDKGNQMALEGKGRKKRPKVTWASERS